MDHFSTTISLVSLTVSLGTFWLAFVDRGRLRMTKPTVVFFGYDTIPKSTPKVFLRTLLYSTATRGQIIEGMYATVRHDGRECVFSFWGYGETEKLSAGSGLYVGRTGVAANHHFLQPIHQNIYRFEAGTYEINIIADIVGRHKPTKLGTIKLMLSNELAATLANGGGVLFERTISGEYEGHSREQ